MGKKKRGGDMITPPLENTIEEMLNNTCDTEDDIETGLDADSSIDKLEGTKDSIEHGKTLPETPPLINGSNDNDLADENSGDYIHDDNDDNGYNGGNDDNDDNDDNDNDFDNNDDNDGQGYQMVSSSPETLEESNNKDSTPQSSNEKENKEKQKIIRWMN